jgi:hypothetical protein
VHPAPVGERLALDPAEDVATLLIHADPARRGVEAGALELEQDFADEFGIRPRRPPDGVADADDAFRQRAARELRLEISRG